MSMMLPEEFHAWYELLVSESITGKTDGTYYFPGGGATSNGWQLNGLKDVFWMYVDVTDGVAGDWTVTVEAWFRGDTRADPWIDVTNAWFSVASFTADTALDRSTITACLNAVRLKCVRANDGANNDGAVAVCGSFQRKVVG